MEFALISTLILQEIIQDRDEERDRLRKEIQRMRAMLPRESAVSSVRTSSLSATTGPGSRPASFISIEESSGPETTASERNQESEDDGGKSTVCYIITGNLSFLVFKVSLKSEPYQKTCIKETTVHTTSVLIWCFRIEFFSTYTR